MIITMFIIVIVIIISDNKTKNKEKKNQRCLYLLTQSTLKCCASAVEPSSAAEFRLYDSFRALSAGNVAIVIVIIIAWYTQGFINRKHIRYWEDLGFNFFTTQPPFDSALYSFQFIHTCMPAKANVTHAHQQL